MKPEKTVRKQVRGKFRPGVSGNPSGRPRGALNQTTRVLQNLIDDEGADIIRKLIGMAKRGNPVALRLVVERLIPPRKELPLSLQLPQIEGVEGLPKLTAAILAGVGKGEMEPGQAAALTSLVATHGKALELAELERRVSALEGKT